MKHQSNMEHQTILYSKITEAVKVTVLPVFLEDRSSVKDNIFSWAYNVRIENLADYFVKLMSRYWKIIDTNALMQEVKGDGVVGEQPIIEPGKVFVYTSAVYLYTPSGMMFGHYKLKNLKDGSFFEVDIPAFSLDSPHDERPPI